MHDYEDLDDEDVLINRENVWYFYAYFAGEAAQLLQEFLEIANISEASKRFIEFGNHPVKVVGHEQFDEIMDAFGLLIDDYYVSAELRVYGDSSDEEAVLHLPEDEYYGSDFALANEAIVAVMPRCWNHSHYGVSVEPWKAGTKPMPTSTPPIKIGSQTQTDFQEFFNTQAW